MFWIQSNILPLNRYFIRNICDKLGTRLYICDVCARVCAVWFLLYTYIDVYADNKTIDMRRQQGSIVTLQQVKRTTTKSSIRITEYGYTILLTAHGSITHPACLSDLSNRDEEEIYTPHVWASERARHDFA